MSNNILNQPENLPILYALGEPLYEKFYTSNDDVVVVHVESTASNVDLANFLANESIEDKRLFVSTDNATLPNTMQEFHKERNSLKDTLNSVGFIAEFVKAYPVNENLKRSRKDQEIDFLAFELKLTVEAEVDLSSTNIDEVKVKRSKFLVLKALISKLPYAYNMEVIGDLDNKNSIVNSKTQQYAVDKLRQSIYALIRSGIYEHVSIESIVSKEATYQSFVYIAVSNLGFSNRVLSAFAHEPNLYYRYIFLISHIEFMLKRDTFDAELQEAVRKNMETAQRKYYLNEQIRALKKELNPEGASDESDVERLLNQLEKLQIETTHPEIYNKINTEIHRLEIIPSNSQEYYMQQNYVDWLLKAPYRGDALSDIDLRKSRSILNKDHFGLDDVKERILEYLAVLSRVDVVKSPVLCLIGPPGVGKTSLGRSIAEATGRKYTRWALGGISDEAEIRGHRRTYIGSQPGKIISHLSKVGVNNPLFLLDEIDKLASSHKGDPAAALLEVLDPEQNNKFVDNYLEIDYDLSEVLFIATANSYNIPPALLDRMEIIDLGSYTRDEKFQIAKQHILGKLLRRNAIKENEIDFPDRMINLIIDGYTNEPGVRSLERRIERIIRFAIKMIVEEGVKQVKVDKDLVQKILGPVINESNIEQAEFRAKSFVGQITGLAWTQSGGDVLPIEAATPVGKGEISATGSLGNQIKESIRAAITVIRQRYKQFDLEPDFYSKYDFHVHFPNAGINKDGPSAGSAITTCLISALTNKPIAMDIGMTGEISLHGDVLRIGGVKEKVISAHRNGVKHIILPKSNEPDLYKVPQSIKDELQFYPVETIDEVIDIVFGDKKRPAKPSAADLDLKDIVEEVKATETTKAKSKKSKAKSKQTSSAVEESEYSVSKTTVKETKVAKASKKAKTSATAKSKKENLEVVEEVKVAPKKRGRKAKDVIEDQATEAKKVTKTRKSTKKS
ncbi:endopeptidase La [Psittacicella gerlachiana]|uniref:endopeptidase La n=1 Tax=Psittacicella gerlachiana TaxID=2028574 RepID=A0A3A1YEN5_9GAMM|nr:endopeptidase La [Psittacicella gerlachiana]RIY34674.1 endopeptidase La [Psittacicella gerlachiana]